MVDNFEKLKDILTFENDDEFYFGKVIARKKDGFSDLAQRYIRSFFINSFEDIEKKKNEIIDLCQMYHARFYINPSVKSRKQCAHEMLKILSEKIYSDNYGGLQSITDSAAGKIGSKRPIWILDIDDELGISDESIDNIVYCIESARPDGVARFVCTLPTCKGKHVLIRPFNINDIRESALCRVGNIIDTNKSTTRVKKVITETMHKNNPTLVYFCG